MPTELIPTLVKDIQFKRYPIGTVLREANNASIVHNATTLDHDHWVCPAGHYVHGAERAAERERRRHRYRRSRNQLDGIGSWRLGDRRDDRTPDQVRQNR